MPCFLACETGLVQSLVPSARPMKLATALGVLSSNSVQVKLPAEVSMMALGFSAFSFAARGSARINTRMMAENLRMVGFPPDSRYGPAGGGRAGQTRYS